MEKKHARRGLACFVSCSSHSHKLRSLAYLVISLRVSGSRMLRGVR